MRKNKKCLGMVDISQKEVTVRKAIAQAIISFTSKAYNTLLKEGSPKGDIFETAKIAGIMAAKSVPALIPLCHPLVLEKVKIDFQKLNSKKSIRVTAEVVCSGKTGVEMEALTAASVACLTIYDMSKWMGQEMTISSVCLLNKSGGKSGEYRLC